MTKLQCLRKHARLSIVDLKTMVAMRNRGLSCAEIGESLARSASTVSRAIARDKAAEIPSARTRPTMVHVIQRRKLVARLATKKMVVKAEGKKDKKVRPAHATLESIRVHLHHHHGISVSRMTISRDLRASRLLCRVRPRVCTVKTTDMAKRRAFARCHKGGPGTPCPIVFSDEKIFTCNDQTSRTMYVKSRKQLIPREACRWTPRLMVWGAIGVGFQHFMILPKPRTTRNEPDEFKLGTVTSLNYRRVVLPEVKAELRKPGRIFMQDGARPHTCDATLKYLRGNSITVLSDWPPRSPDLNPIENLWAVMQRRVSATAPRDVTELRAALIRVFTGLQSEQPMIDAFVNSFPRRCEDVYQLQGGAG